MRIGDTNVFTVQEISERLDISVHTIKRYIRSGKLTGMKFGRSVYVTEQSLVDYLNGKTK